LSAKQIGSAGGFQHAVHPAAEQFDFCDDGRSHVGIIELA
jgi:hypothetical protein